MSRKRSCLGRLLLIIIIVGLDVYKRQEQHISENLVSIANTLSQLPCDPFAIEDQIRGYYPDFYKTHNFDEVYANAEFQITVEAIITNEGKK